MSCEFSCCLHDVVCAMLSPLGHDDQNQVSAGLRCVGICRVLPMGSKTEFECCVPTKRTISTANSDSRLSWALCFIHKGMLAVRSYSVLFGRVAARQVSLGLGFDLMGLRSSMTDDNLTMITLIYARHTAFYIISCLIYASAGCLLMLTVHGILVKLWIGRGQEKLSKEHVLYFIVLARFIHTSSTTVLVGSRTKLCSFEVWSLIVCGSYPVLQLWTSHSHLRA